MPVKWLALPKLNNLIFLPPKQNLIAGTLLYPGGLFIVCIIGLLPKADAPQ
jgi:hypothetical protein